MPIHKLLFGKDARVVQHPWALVGALTLLVLWSIWYVVTRLGVTGNLTPADITLLRYIVGVLITWPFFFFWKGRKIPWKALAIIVPTFGLFYVVPLFYGLQTSPVANAGVLVNGMLPVINGIMAWLLFREGLAKRKWVAIAILVVANACMFVAHEVANLELTIGWLLIFIGVVSMSIYMTVIRKHPIDHVVMLPMMSFGNLALFLPLFPFLESNFFGGTAFEYILQIVYQGIINQLIVIVLATYVITRLGSVTTSVLLGFVPALAAIFGVIFLDEHLVLLEIVGIVGCTVGIIMFARSRV